MQGIGGTAVWRVCLPLEALAESLISRRSGKWRNFRELRRFQPEVACTIFRLLYFGIFPKRIMYVVKIKIDTIVDAIFFNFFKVLLWEN